MRDGERSCDGSDCLAPLRTLQQIDNRLRHGRRIHRRNGDGSIRCQIADVTNCGSNDGKSGGSRFENGNAAAFMSRRLNIQMCPTMKTGQLVVSGEPVEPHGITDSKRASLPLKSAVENVLTNEIEMNVERPAGDRQRVKQRRLVLDAIETCNLQQPPGRTVRALG